MKLYTYCSILSILMYGNALCTSVMHNYAEETLTKVDDDVDVNAINQENPSEETSKALKFDELLELQQNLIDDRDIKARLANMKDLETLTKKGILISEDTFAGIENLVEESDDSDGIIPVTKKMSVLIEVDLLNIHNMNTVLYEGLKYEIDSKDSVLNNLGDQNINKVEKFKKDAYQKLSDTQEQDSDAVNLLHSINNLKDKLENNKDLSVNDVWDNLNHIYHLLKSFKKNDKSIQDNVFYNFIKGMLKVYNVQIARAIAIQFMENNKLNIEDTVLSATTKNANIKEGYSDTSLFTNKFSLGGTVDIIEGESGFGKAGISVGAKYSREDIFYTVEQLLDSGEIGITTKLSWFLINKNLHKARKSRNDMQKKELDLLKTFQSSIEFYLKFAKIIPNNVSIMWPSITRSTSQEISRSISGSLKAYAELREVAGFSIETDATASRWSKHLEYMSLITKDCSPSYKMTVEDIIKILQKGHKEKEEKLKVLQNVEAQINLLSADLSHYLNILSAYDLKRTSELKDKKREFEQLHQFNKHTKGRLGVFKYMLSMALLTRSYANTHEQIELFKKFYKLLEKLALKQNFSRNRRNRTARYSLHTLSNSQSVSGNCELKIPGISGTGISFIRSRIRDIPFQESNGDYWELQIHVPSAVVGAWLTKDIKDKLLSSSKLDKNDDENLLDYKDPFEQSSQLIEKIQLAGALGNIASGGLIKGTTSISAVCARVNADIISYPNIKGVNQTPNYDAHIQLQLPGKPLQEKLENEWVNLYWMVTSSVSTSVIPLDVSLSQPIRQIGTDTLMYLTGRYNVCALGFNDEFSSNVITDNDDKKIIRFTLSSNAKKLSLKDISDKIDQGKLDEISAFSQWIKVKEQQHTPLYEILENIGKDHKNLLYELQGMYTSIMSNIQSDKKDECTKLFKDFLDECNKLSKKNENIKVDHTIKLLEKIFWYNYLYNFKLSYEKAYSAK